MVKTKLTDSYLRKLILNSKLSKDIGLKASDLTNDIIELKRRQLKLHREIRGAMKLLKKGGD